MKTKIRQLGQGMTEYIIIVALIAIAAIAVYGFFGDTIRGQVATMTSELAGTDSGAGRAAAGAASGNADGDAGTAKTLSNFEN